MNTTIEIIKKLHVIFKRARIAKNAKESLKDFHSGKLKPMNAEQAIRHLDALIEKN